MPRPNPTPEELEIDMRPHPRPTENMSDDALLARATRLAKAVVSGGAPPLDEEILEPKPGRGG